MADFPGIPETVWQTEYDFSQFDSNQMQVLVCSVPWDIGLIHVGTAQIPELGNIVYFDSKDKRNEYLQNLEDKYVFTTKYRSWQNELTIQIPLPYNTCIKYNYVWIRQYKEPVDYASEYFDVFYFIREISQLAPSTCECTLMLDAWQTFIYDIEVNGLYLEQGHIANVQTNVSEYLANPRENCKYLLDEDIKPTNNSTISNTVNVYNMTGADPYVVVCTKCGIYESWYNERIIDLNVPYYCDSAINSIAFGVPQELYYIAMTVNTWYDMLMNYWLEFPQFFQGIQCCYVIDKKYLDLGEPIELFGIKWYNLYYNVWTNTNYELKQSDFNFSDEYKDLTKLYTYPYSWLHISSSQNDYNVHIEEIGKGGYGVEAGLNNYFPAIQLNAIITGVNSNITDVKLMRLQTDTVGLPAKLKQCLFTFKVPTYAATVSGQIAAKFDEYYDRLQAVNDATTYKSQSYNTADTTEKNGALTGTMQKNIGTNTSNMQEAIGANNRQMLYDIVGYQNQMYRDIANANIECATSTMNNSNLCSTNITTKKNATAADKWARSVLHQATMVGYQNEYNDGVCTANNEMTTNTAAAEVEYTTNTVAAGNTGTAIFGLEDTASAMGADVLGGALIGGTLGGPAGALVGAGVGAITGYLFNNGIGATFDVGVQTGLATANGSYEIGLTNAQKDATNRNRSTITGYQNSLNRENYQENIEYSYDQLMYDIDNATTCNNLNIACNKANTELNNDLTDAVCDYTTEENTNEYSTRAETTYTNAVLESENTLANAILQGNNTTTVAANEAATIRTNADLKYNNDMMKMYNHWRQRLTNEPKRYGQTQTTGFDNVPQAIMFSIEHINQSDEALVGDEWLRRGYKCARYFKFTDWRIMPKFTYWKCKEIYMKSLIAPDKYIDLIRFYLLGGVTVWNDPADIGHTPIYENV